MIEFVGARPGEKLHEELWGEGETVAPTSHPKIMRVTRPTDRRRLARRTSSRELERLVREGETLELVARLAT